MNLADPPTLPMQADPGSCSSSKLEQESLLPELLHAMNQPLTSLRCSLELTLLQPRDSEEYRKRLRESLRLTEDIVVLSSGIRELLDVEQPSENVGRVAFERVLESSVRELLPLAEEQEIRLILNCTSVLPVLGDSQRYLAALLYFLSFLFSFAKPSDELRVTAGVDDAWITFRMALEKAAAKVDESTWNGTDAAGSARSYLRLLIARRIFEIEGGNVSVDREKQRICLSVKLPRLQDIGQVPDAVPEGPLQQSA
jgi:hypothetical protein